MVSRQVHVSPRGLNAIEVSRSSRYVGYGVALLCAAAGGVLLTGLWQSGASRTLDSAFGAVLVLLGINRYFVTRLKSRRRRPRSWERDADS